VSAKSHTVTRAVAAALFALIILADCVLTLCGHPTISYAVTWLVSKHQLGYLLPFGMGTLVSHWCWVSKGPAGMTTKKWLRLALVVFLVSLDIFLFAYHVPTLSSGTFWLIRHCELGWLAPFVAGVLVSRWSWGSTDV
jgi:hypothetical protein